jgi:hypothetical protein
LPSETPTAPSPLTTWLPVRLTLPLMSPARIAVAWSPVTEMEPEFCRLPVSRPWMRMPTESLPWMMIEPASLPIVPA